VREGATPSALRSRLPPSQRNTTLSCRPFARTVRDRRLRGRVEDARGYRRLSERDPHRTRSHARVRLPLVVTRARFAKERARAMEERGAPSLSVCVVCFTTTTGWRARTGGNLRARRVSRSGARSKRPRSAVVYTVALKGRERLSRPMVFQRLPPRLSFARTRVCALRGARASLEPRDASPAHTHPDSAGISLCRSPRKRGGGPRVLGRAARLIEGPHIPTTAARNRGGRSGRDAEGRERERKLPALAG